MRRPTGERPAGSDQCPPGGGAMQSATGFGRRDAGVGGFLRSLPWGEGEGEGRRASDRLVAPRAAGRGSYPALGIRRRRGGQPLVGSARTSSIPVRAADPTGIDTPGRKSATPISPSGRMATAPIDVQARNIGARSSDDGPAGGGTAPPHRSVHRPWSSRRPFGFQRTTTKGTGKAGLIAARAVKPRSRSRPR